MPFSPPSDQTPALLALSSVWILSLSDPLLELESFSEMEPAAMEEETPLSTEN